MKGFGYEKGAHNDFLLGEMKGVGYVLFAHNDLDDEKQGQSANEQVSQATQRASQPNHQASELQTASQHSHRSVSPVWG